MKYLMLLLAPIFILLSCKNDAKKNAKAFQTWNADSLGFSIQYPSNYEPIQNLNPYIQLAFMEIMKDSSKDFYRENLMINAQPYPVGKSQYQYAQAAKTEILLGLPGTEFYDEDSTAKDSIFIHEYKFDRSTDSAVTFVIKQYIIPLKDRAYTLSATMMKANESEYEAIFDNMVQNMEFKP